MGRWQDQWALMESYLNAEARAARKDADASTSALRLGEAQGLEKAVRIVEEFRMRLPATELEALLDAMEREFGPDERW